MATINRFIFCLCAGLLVAPLSSSGACRLPIPDGGGEDYVPSKENLFGDIVRVELPLVTVKNGRTQELEQVSVSKINEIYSVYGGDSPLSELKPGLQVWIWFEKCKRPKEGLPFAAYFQIFSTDPIDRATINRQGRIISVPRRLNRNAAIPIAA
ncbi:MAG TPA: hypothetical protein VJ576_10085 [Rhodocyclaceae bacterium]|nr:hypothetical protein [Rhodocyclaceae bacterium]